MNKGLLAIIAATIIVVIAGAFFLSGNNPQPSKPAITQAPAELEYYWGNGCPHCEVVAEFLDSWDKKDEVTINKFETWYNKENESRLQAVGAYCNIPSNQVGVPLLFTPDGQCLIGDTPIIDYLKSL